MKFVTCLSDGSEAYALSCITTSQLLTSMGPQQADSLTANTKALLTVNGVDANGDVLCTSLNGGTLANSITAQFDTGPTGGGNENLVLRVSVTSTAILVEFATDGSGNSITPTGEAVKDLLLADDPSSALVIASCPGTGLSNAAAIAATALAGGLDDGNYLKILGNPPSVRRITRIEA